MTSCYIQVNIEYKSGLKSFTLTPNRKHLGKSLQEEVHMPLYPIS